jgi:hypothetical protein
VRQDRICNQILSSAWVIKEGTHRERLGCNAGA